MCTGGYEKLNFLFILKQIIFLSIYFAYCRYQPQKFLYISEQYCLFLRYSLGIFAVSERIFQKGRSN